MVGLEWQYEWQCCTVSKVLDRALSICQQKTSSIRTRLQSTSPLIRMVPDNTSVSTRGQRVVVVGATGGIGLGVALQFAKTGAEVWIVGRNSKTGICSS